METFTWLVDVGSSVEPEFRLKTAQMGNGYEQTVGDGLNTVIERWNVNMFGDIVNIGPAYRFLVQHAGHRSFLWTTPLGDEIKVKATDVKMPSNGASTYTLSATFTQSFTPN